MSVNSKEGGREREKRGRRGKTDEKGENRQGERGGRTGHLDSSWVVPASVLM